jgi:hypothetical protein
VYAILSGKNSTRFLRAAEKGQCSMGWFYGFMLHIVINDKGEILDFLFTLGNVDDREPLKKQRLP